MNCFLLLSVKRIIAFEKIVAVYVFIIKIVTNWNIWTQPVWNIRFAFLIWTNFCLFLLKINILKKPIVFVIIWVFKTSYSFGLFINIYIIQSLFFIRVVTISKLPCQLAIFYWSPFILKNRFKNIIKCY